jgi:hypothetical protein
MAGCSSVFHCMPHVFDLYVRNKGKRGKKTIFLQKIASGLRVERFRKLA